MGDTAISWTDKTWNPLTGCTRVSAGCDHCYAFQLHDTRHVAWKRGRMPTAAPQYHQPFSRVQLFPERLTQPLHWRKPARVFVNSMSDLFHEAVPDEFICRVFAVMAISPWHTYQILTKRPERMAALLGNWRWWGEVTPAMARLPLPAGTGQLAAAMNRAADFNFERGRPGFTEPWPLPNVWLGVSVENQQAADERIPHLLRTPAAVRFISAEPLLGLMNIEPFLYLTAPSTAGPWRDWAGVIRERGGGLGGQMMSSRPSGDIGWVIAGGESGPHARPMHPDWVRSLRDQCVEAGVKFYFKQWGGRTPKAGGRELDGRTWDEFPVLRRLHGLCAGGDGTGAQADVHLRHRPGGVGR